MANTMLEDFDSEFGPGVGKELGRAAAEASMVLLVGQTGAGKSHFINSVAPGSCKESARLGSCTQKPALVDITFDGKELLLIDTPGFNDTRSGLDRSDAVILDEIARMIAVQAALGVKMRGILYLHDIHAARMTGEAVRQIEMLKRICGPENWGNVMLVTTKWPPKEYQQQHNLAVREGDLRREYWREMIRGGSKMWRFEDNKVSAQAIIRSLMQKQPVMFALLKEMAKGQPLAKTAAGAFVISERHNDEERHEKLSQNLKSTPHDKELAQEVETLQESIEQRRKNEDKLEEDIVGTVEKNMKTTVKEELKKLGSRPTVANVIMWFLSVGSFTANIVLALT